VALLLSAFVLGGFSIPLGSLPSLGSLLDPSSGLWPVAFGTRVPVSNTVRVPGLIAPVTIVRDMAGVPHIYAASDEDGWFALGYVHAQDRLWQMDIQYRAASGRLSEILGSGFISTDEFFRTIGLDRIAANATAARTSADGLDAHVIQSFTAGVNAYLSALDPPNYPLEFKLLGYAPERWSAEKSIAEGALIAWGLAGDFSDLAYNLIVEEFGATRAQELFPVYPAGVQIPIQPSAVSAVPLVSIAAAKDILRKAHLASHFVPDFEEAGSNNWAILGNRTASGKPYLATDPHLSFQLPAVWYWAELQAQTYHVHGATFPGIPGFFFGTNGHIGWGETNTGADVNDFFVETLNANRTQYEYEGAWHDLTVYDEPIHVLGGSTIPFRVLETRHGPILTEFNQTVAMESTIRFFGQELETMLLIDRAENWTEFRDALRYWRVPAQNFVYADALGTYGNIGIRSNGLYPLRGNFSGRLPVDGSSGEHEWTGFVPFDSYPEAYDPLQGFVLSANEVPAPPNYPYMSALGSLFDPGYRARRIHMLLASDGQVTWDVFRTFQQDVYDVGAASIVPYLLRAVTPQNSVESDAYQALQAWDDNVTLDSVAGTIWNTFTSEYMDRTFGDEYRAASATDLPEPQFNTLEDLTINNPASPWFDNVTTSNAVETRDDVLRESFAAAVQNLTSRLGSGVTSWTWSAVHFRNFPHLSGIEALSRGPFASPGDGFTVNVAGGLVVEHGPSWRMLLDFHELSQGLAIYPGGQSGLPLSVHYDDFIHTYMEGDYLPFRAADNPSRIQGDFTESTLQLLPG
jgi:penicillin amidase